MDKTIDMKFIGTLVVFIGTMGGFYFTTSYRLDALEKKVEVLEQNGEAIIRLEERVKGIQNKTDEIYKHIIEFIRDGDS
tara:strand:- start:13545 stop:13781 length:237 start_codon:yes stop_codon:yes gene_type:complete